MKKKLSNQFLSNYLIVFIFTITATILAFFLLSFASGLISHALAKNRYPASSIMRDEYNLIDASLVVQNGGGVQIVDKDYRVVYTVGIDNIGKSRLSVGEWTYFLVQSKSVSIPYHYDIAYNPAGQFWLVVTFPTSLRIDFSLVSNKDAALRDRVMATGVLASVLIIYTLMLSAITFIYSRITARGITRPLKKLCEGTKLLREGDYSARVDLRLKNEFAELQDTFNDMAARIGHEMALRKKSENDRRQLILDISHDLKNPLSSVSGYAELCLKKPDLPEEERRNYLQVIHKNSQRANILLNELLELSKLDSPEFTLKPVKTELCEYLRQICGELLPLLEKAGFGYVFDIPEKSLYAMIDSERMGRVFQNLSDNALRYNKEGTKVSISLSEQEGNAIILFSDNGCGIPKELSEDIFKPFVRVDTSRNSDSGGSGLGLAISKKIAQAHGGDLTLIDCEGQGCTFKITLPLI